MSVDNLELIKHLLVFDNENEFYYLQILQRKSDNAELGSNSRVVKNYYITSYEHLVSIYEEIKSLCEIFGARACLRLNRRSFEQVAFKSLENIANSFQTRNYKHISKQYDRACGLLNIERVKRWIVDIDKPHLEYIDAIIHAIDMCEPDGHKLLVVVPSKTGKHLITTPFNVIQFKQQLSLILEHKHQLTDELLLDIHKDNPTNLYIH